jgi:hypothetical protein
MVVGEAVNTAVRHDVAAHAYSHPRVRAHGGCTAVITATARLAALRGRVAVLRSWTRVTGCNALYTPAGGDIAHGQHGIARAIRSARTTCCGLCGHDIRGI